MSHDDEVTAVEVLACLEAKSVNDPYVSTLRNEIAYSIHYERENSVKWSQLFFDYKKNNSTKTMRRLLLGAGTQFMQQFQGINIMSYYLPTVLISEAIPFP